MGCCANCTLFIISFIATGFIVATSALCLYVINKNDLSSIAPTKTFLISSIVVFGVSVFILAFSIYASISKRRCPAFFLGLFLLFYALFIIGMIVIYVVFYSKLFDELGNQWNKHRGDGTPIGNAIDNYEKDHHCSYWNESSGSCKPLVQKLMKKVSIYYYSILGSVALFLLIAVIIAFWKTCHKEETTSDKQNPLLEQPLSYGW
ncbi:Tetraspanin family protein [Trichomonas vaginalis G3]|uniref:Tetraspanin family protein n=1 Tax=Trichomonas vaginalis (strain ATCC PRA-98 / G3) TaxID=412133 RepID=A2FKF6_TRIV3|nr:hypothetical protein TVAGG3_0247110 [Trichomonas vaginalis G3]EAX94622.1 Tetraspanin family protein [Trichomonas vaginalis G3]KAI5553736.1 hypothetical protein TVAGG3_0247110 [Trichomonas vaginalis G3]|eukprot:XP_001307552.1 Tetraspanin family protein [Trichomonas vaginalis G3]